MDNLSKQQQTTYHNSFADEGDAGVEHEEGRTVDTVHDSLQERFDRSHYLHDANGPKAGVNVHVDVARSNLETDITFVTLVFFHDTILKKCLLKNTFLLGFIHRLSFLG